MTAKSWLADTRASYDTVAASYADQVRNAVNGGRGDLVTCGKLRGS
jgi:hypothetical protein